MNVTELKLDPMTYGRANYLKREIVAMVRYAERYATPAKKTELKAFITAAKAYVDAKLP